MKKEEFERILDVCCGALTLEARKSGFKTSKEFENRVRQTLDDLLQGEQSLHVDFSPPPQVFPDIALGEFGVEVKFTLSDTWKSIANSIQESQRAPNVKYIYIVFGKMGGKPEVRWGDYEKSVIHVRTSHVPRFEVELGSQRPSLFEVMGVSYDEFSAMDIHEKMKCVRSYAKALHPNERLWWMGEEEDNHSLPINIRMYTNLSSEEKAAAELEDGLFVEYWGESASPDQRLRKWIEKADGIATTWRPSDVLFGGRYALRKRRGKSHA